MLIDLIERSLTKSKKPLHYAEISRLLLEAGEWKTKGLTPERTVNATLAVDIEKHGKRSRFQRTGKGVFALRTWGLEEYLLSKSKQESPTSRKERAAGKSARVERQRSGLKLDEPPPTRLSFTDAAEYVLKHFGNGRPMHYRTITDKALELRLIRTKGRTPEASLFSQVITEVERDKRRGQQPRFARQPRGLVGLAAARTQGLEAQIQRHNDEVRKRLLARLKSMEPSAFERLVGELLGKLGFDQIDVTRASGDGGIDIRGRLVVGDVIRTSMAVQVKRWKNNVQAPDVQRVRGSLGAHDQGLIVTTSDFSVGARQEAERSDTIPVGLMSGEQFVALLVEHKIGIERSDYHLLSLVDLDDIAAEDQE